MDDSWHLRIGSDLARRKSTDPGSDFSCPTRSSLSESETLDPADFQDVFGGPPRSVFFRQHSGDFSSSFYDEIFRSATESDAPARRGRNLPVFQIPAAPCRRNDGFYDDIFGSGEDRRSRSRSKSNSSSVLSSEDLSPLRPSGADDGGFASFASKLRPIIIPCRQSSSSSTAMSNDQKKQGTAGVPCTRTSFAEFQFAEPASDERFLKSHFGFSQHMPSPETITVKPDSYPSVKITVDDLETDSPSSDISSVGPGPDARNKIQDQSMQESEEEAEFIGSYVIEILSDRREEAAEEAVAIDEAIAWAREKSGAQNTDVLKENCREKENRRGLVKKDEGMCIVPKIDAQARRGYDDTQFLLARASEELKRWESNEEKQQPEKDMEKEMMEEDIKEWSAGKEGNIRSLLSTLQYILWPTSGWHAIPLPDMIETSQVRKAYQKARLCLHPDKLQQKGATIPQKYVAEKVFTILQDAWAAFNAQDFMSG
ncbi:uncharacterized protein LOC131220743 [Magnolia sinica]|uniref:uncharacterized protein LOC131220743 n=1 Tax=Magnolia sinica TaxID=86752 RepID=UPI00265B1879|nr:uncharacterized protein LOC131220743 [Magnolia sinica]